MRRNFYPHEKEHYVQIKISRFSMDKTDGYAQSQEAGSPAPAFSQARRHSHRG